MRCATASAPERERERGDDDERARCRLVSEPELRASSESTISGAGSSNETRTSGGETSRCTSESVDTRLLAILASGPGHGETLDAAFRRKEHELGALFATLDVAASRALHRRLTLPADDDLVAARFGQLISNRRARLLAFLADARRREAIAMARRSLESSKG